MAVSIRAFARGATALLAITVLAACGGPPGSGPGGGDDDSEPFGPGSPHVSDDGTTIAIADPDSDVDPGFEVEERAAPELPLPSGVEPVGPVRRVTAERNAATSPGAPFVIGLPLPDGEDPENLAIALLDRGPVEFDASEEGPTDGTVSWVFLDAFYDEDAELLFAPSVAITPEGWEVVIVRSDAFETRTTSRPSASSRQIGGVDVEFDATCGPQFGASGVTETCGTTERTDAADELEEVFDDLTGLGFTDEPRLTLRPAEVVVDIESLFPLRYGVEIEPGEYVMELRPASQVSNGGMYSSGSGSFWVALGSGGVTDGTRNTIRHEYFHATQYGYDPDLSAGWLRARFSIEGQAVLSEASVPTLGRDGWSLRAVDDTMLRSKWDGSSWRSGPFSEYRAQDFWAFLGLQAGHGDLSYVVPFAEEGMAPEDVDAVLERDWSGAYPDGLEDAYWDWAKNQAFESRDDLGGALNDPCTFLSSVATPIEVSPGSDGSASESIDLDSVESAVVEFELSNSASVRARYELATTLPHGDLVAKFYDPADAGTNDCWSDAELPSKTVTVAAGDTDTYRLLVANVGLSGTRSVEATIEPTANLEIVQPEGTFRVGDTLGFRADVTGAADPSSLTIDWSAEDSNDDAVSLPFTTTSGGVESYGDVPCDDLVIRAETTLPSGTTISDIVPISCEPPVETYRYEVDRSISGMVTSDGRVQDGSVIDDILIGDDAANEGMHGLLHVDLPTLPDDLEAIESATLIVSFETPVGTPFSDLGELNVVHVDYGSSMDATNYRVAPTDTEFHPGFASTTDTDFGRTEIDVTTHVEDAWDHRDTRGRRVQFLPYVALETDGDDVADHYVLNFEDRPGTDLIPALEVTFRNYYE